MGCEHRRVITHEIVILNSVITLQATYTDQEGLRVIVAHVGGHFVSIAEVVDRDAFLVVCDVDRWRDFGKLLAVNLGFVLGERNLGSVLSCPLESQGATRDAFQLSESHFTLS
jgi:hypothetical protein